MKILLDKVQKFAFPYEDKYSMAVELSNEDFAIADLIKNSQDFKITWHGKGSFKI